MNFMSPWTLFDKVKGFFGNLPNKNKLVRRLPILAAVLILIFFGVMAFRNGFHAQTKISALDPRVAADLARANNAKVLGEDQTAVLAISGQESNPNGEKLKLILSDQTEYTALTDKVSSLISINGKGQTVLLGNSSDNSPVKTDIVNLNASNQMLGKINRKVKDKIDKEKSADVIISLADLPQPNKDEDTTKRRERIKNLKSKKDKLLQEGHNNITEREELNIINAFSAHINQRGLEILEQSSDVASIEPVVKYYTNLDISVSTIQAPRVWPFFDNSNQSLTGKGQVIAILDTGVDYTHPDLGGCLGINCKVIGGYDFNNNDNDPMDDAGHGTHVAAIAASRGTLSGVAPDAKILAYKVCSATGSCWNDRIIAATGRATDPNNDGDTSDHVSAANLSLGTTSAGNPDDQMSLAVDNATAAGVAFAIAAGNNWDPGSISSPGVARTAITVAAACDRADYFCPNYRTGSFTTAMFSSKGPAYDSRGNDLHKPDISAPGVNICAARYDNAFPEYICNGTTNHVAISGTSMATPHVAGAIALVRQAYPQFSPAEVKDRLKLTANPFGSYDYSGAGMINLANAIPAPALINANPGGWSVETNPAVKTTTVSKTFALVSKNAAVGIVQPSSSISKAGINITFDKQSLDLTNFGSGNLTVTVTADNDLAAAGIINGELLLKSGSGTTQGLIPVTLNIKSGLEVTPTGTIDFGWDDANLASWTSAVKTVSIKNLRTDRTVTVNLSSSGLPSGVQMRFNQNSITIPALGSGNAGANLYIANNASVPDATYSSYLQLGYNASTFSVSTTFTKYNGIRINDPTATDTNYAVSVVISNPTAGFLYTGAITTNPLIVKTTATGAYSISVVHKRLNADANGNQPNYYFFKTLNLPGDATFNILEQDARNTIQMDMKNEFGQPVDAKYRLGGFTDSNGQYSVTFAEAGSKGRLNKSYATNFGTNVQFHWVFSSIINAPILYAKAQSIIGLSGNITESFNASQVRKMLLASYLYEPPRSDIQNGESLSFHINPLVVSSSSPHLIAATPLLYYGSQHLPYDSHYLYYDSPGNWGVQYMVQHYSPSYYQENLNYNSTYANSVAIAPNDGARAVGWDNLPGKLDLNSRAVTAGLGPSFFIPQFDNKIDNTWATIQFKNIYNYALLRQDYSQSPNPPLAYQIFKYGQLWKQGTITGTTGGTSALKIINLYADIYQFKIDSIPYQIQNINLNGKVDITFDTRAADPNPPALRQIGIYADNQPTETYDKTKNNRFEFILDPVGGTISQAQASYSLDSTNFNNLAVSLNNGIYSTAIPSLDNVQILTLKVTATDSTGNIFSNSFQIPVGTTSLPPIPPSLLADHTSPSVNLTDPKEGQVFSQEVIPVKVNASDGNGVKRVELYVNDKLTDTEFVPLSAPQYYFARWSTGPLNGDYTLKAKAYDRLGNIGESPPVHIQINPMSNPNYNLIFASPSSNNTVVSGKVNIVLANGSSSNQYFFFLDENNGIRTSIPFEWDSATVPLGQHYFKLIQTPSGGQTPPMYFYVVPPSPEVIINNTAVSNSQATVTIKVKNSAPLNSVSDPTISYSLPAGMEYVSATGGYESYYDSTNRRLSWQLPPIAANSSVEVSFQAIVADASKITGSKAQLNFDDGVSYRRMVESNNLAFDNSAPYGTLSLTPYNSSMNNYLPIVNLNISASDDYGPLRSGVASMQITNATATAGAWPTTGTTDWLTYATSYSNWDVTDARYGGNSQPGQKTVYIRFRDNAGNISLPVSAQFTYDLAPLPI